MTSASFANCRPRRLNLRIGTTRSHMVTNRGYMVNGSWSRYHVSPGIRALSESHVNMYCLNRVSNNRPVPDVFFWWGCKVDKGPGHNSLHSQGANWPVVLINHALAIKESNKHDLTSTFLQSHFLQLQLALMQPDRWFIFQKGITVMNPWLIISNNLCQKLWLISDHCKGFGASVEMSLNFIHLQEVQYRCRAHSLHFQFARYNSMNGFLTDFQFCSEGSYWLITVLYNGSHDGTDIHHCVHSFWLSTPRLELHRLLAIHKPQTFYVIF